MARDVKEQGSIGKDSKPGRRFRLEQLGLLGLLGVLGFLEFLYRPLVLFHLFFLFFLVYMIEPVGRFLRLAWLMTLGRLGTGRLGAAEAVKARQEAKVMARFNLLALLAGSLNPFLLVMSLAQLGGQVVATARYRGRLPCPESYQQHNRFTVPLAGCWLVANGGVDEATSHSWELVGQRYAYDFVIDQEGRSYQGEGRRLEDYYAFGQPILAPAAGRVVQVREGIRDYPRVEPLSGKIDWLTRDFRGNFVVIDHGHQEYSFLAHLQRGSVRVRVGDKVSQGQIIGLCGNSGHSSEPHLHFHVQDHPNFFLAVSLPVRFAGFRLSDDPETASRSEAYLSRGQRIVAAPSNPESALQTRPLAEGQQTLAGAELA